MHPRAVAIGALVFAGLGLASSLSAWTIHGRSEVALRNAMSADLEHLAAAAASTIDPEDLAALQEPTQEGSATYVRVQAPLRAILAAVSTLRFVYTDEVQYVVDATPTGDADHDGVEDHSALGDVEAEPDEKMVHALRTGAVASNSEPYPSAWGDLVSGYAPLIADDGAVVGVVGVDITAGTYAGELAKLRHQMTLAALGGLVIAGVAGAGAALAFNTRLASEQEKEAAELRMRQLLEALPDDLARLDCFGRCLDATPGRLNLEVADTEWFVGTHPHVGATAHGSLDDAISRAWTTEQPSVERGILPDGRVIELTLTRAGGEIIAVQRDVTDQTRAMEAERDARYAEASALAARSRFLTNMTHHVRTPLHGILGMTELVLETDLDEEQHHCLQSADRSARQLLKILDDILDLTRVDAAELRLRNQPTDLAELGRQAVNRCRRLPEAAGRTIAVVCPDASVANADAGRVRQILDEILTNAIIHGRGSVTLSLVYEGGLATFSVTDEGPGFSDREVAAIDDPLADRSGHEQGLGLGLGLALAARLARYMGGQLTVRAESGHGAQVLITLPAPAVGAEDDVGELEPSA
jgi:signal transduction histidine kinase